MDNQANNELAEIAKDLTIEDLPEDSRIPIAARFAEEFLNRASVGIAGNMSPEDAQKLAQLESMEDQINFIEEVYGQSFREINDVLYSELVTEFKNLMNNRL